VIIIYKPAGGEREEYDASTLRVSEVSIVQRTIDMKWADIKAGLPDEDLDAMRGIVWVLKKRSQPSLRFSEFDPGVTEMVTRYDKSEIRILIENVMDTVARDPEIDRERVAEALSELADAAHDPEHCRQLIAELTAQDAPKEEPSPEETSPSEPSPNPTSSTPDSSTSDSSPTSSTSPQQPSTP
jgi:hypothetical protein